MTATLEHTLVAQMRCAFILLALIHVNVKEAFKVMDGIVLVCQLSLPLLCKTECLLDMGSFLYWAS